MVETDTARCRTCGQSALTIEEFSFWKPGKRYKSVMDVEHASSTGMRMQVIKYR
jgi:hypothetical protein